MTETGIVVIALASALAAATSGVLQHHCARRAPHDQTHRLLGHLLTRPAWITGLVAAGIGLVLHALALAAGQLAVVQPLLISGILFALPLSALLERRRPSGREWMWAVILVGGLAVFLLAAHPRPGRVSLDADVLAWATVSGLVVVAVLALLGMRWQHGHAPALLGTAAGIGYGVVAALLKETTTVARSGLVNVLTDWPLYAMIAMGAASLALTQMAYRAGPLARSMPALTIADPAASVALGALAFQERLASGPLPVSTEMAGFVLMTFAAIQLARQDKTPRDESDPYRATSTTVAS
jgi:drug/metabolite transporter (DMT)-like permease